MGTVGALTKDNPARMKRDVTIAAKRLEGQSVREIARAMDVSIATVSRALNDEEIKSVIDDTTRHVAKLAPRVFTNLELMTSEDMLAMDKKLFLEGTRDLSRILQFTPSATPNTLIANVFNDNRTQIIDPDILQALSGYMGAEEIEEAEVVE